MSVVFVLEAIAALAFMIVVHEGGHFFVARWCKMRIERFSIGFGPGILKHRSAKTGTTFQLAPIPFGGFVEIQGMNIAEEVDPEDALAYPNRPVWQRFLTILAGPATNYLSAIVLAFGLYTCHGMPSDREHVVEAIAGYDAADKVKPDDHVIAADHVPVSNTAGLSEIVITKAGKPLLLTIRRATGSDDAEGNPIEHDLDIVVTPKLVLDDAGKPMTDAKDRPLYRLGIAQSPDIVSVGLDVAAEKALEFPIDTTKLIATGLWGIITGEQAADPAGPVRIVSEFRKAFENGFVSGISLMMSLSVYLGLFNLFPLPALDGGRLVFLGYEMVTRRRANPKIEATIHMAGILVLGVVMILVLVRDCGHVLSG